MRESIQKKMKSVFAGMVEFFACIQLFAARVYADGINAAGKVSESPLAKLAGIANKAFVILTGVVILALGASYLWFKYGNRKKYRRE